MEDAMDEGNFTPRFPERRATDSDTSKSAYAGPERRKTPREDFGGDEEWRDFDRR